MEVGDREDLDLVRQLGAWYRSGGQGRGGGQATEEGKAVEGGLVWVACRP